MLSTSAPRWQMPQHSQDRAHPAQSNQNFFRHANGGSPGAGSGTARSAVGPWQAGQGGGRRGVALAGPGSSAIIAVPMAETPTRATLPDGTLRLSAGKCLFEFSKPGPSVLLVRISGRDVGQFGPSVFEEVRLHFSGTGALELFVDATEADGPTTEVSQAWTRFFNREAPNLKRVSILAVSKFVHLTVSIAKLFSRTGELIQVYSDPKLFKDALGRATGKR